MMNARSILTLFLIALTFLSQAQTNYKEGYIITNDGASIKGFINYREWHKNPDRVQFKQDPLASVARTFTVDSIAGFTIAGYETYTRYLVPVSMDEISFENLKETIDTATITKTIFLREMLKGDRVDLYSYADDIKVRYYLLEKGQLVPYELIYRKLLREGQEITQASYKQQLSGLAHHHNMLSRTLEDRINKLNYSGNDIKNIISRINTQNETATSASIDNKKRWDFFAGAGIAMSTVKYKGETLLLVDGFDDMGRFKYKSEIITHSYLPRISAAADVYINPAIRRLIFRTELSVTNIKSTVRSYYKFSIYSDEEENTYRFSSWNFGFSPQLVYNLFNTNKYKGYIGAGFLLSYINNTRNSLERRDPQTGSLIAVNKEYLIIREFAMNAIIRSGLRINEKIDLSLIWTNPIEYTNYQAGRQSVKAGLLSLSIMYHLKK
jgi:hypothetical protein